MSTRSKKLAAIVMCLLSLSLAVGAVLLSPAMTSIEKQIRLQKCGIIGTPIRFESADFDQVLCTKSEFIRMDTLPTLAEGTLLVGSTPISENQLIARADFDKMTFWCRPTTPSVLPPSPFPTQPPSKVPSKSPAP